MVGAALQACPSEKEKKVVLDTIGEEIVASLAYANEHQFLYDIKTILKALIMAFSNIEDKMNFSEKFVGDLYVQFGKICKVIDESKLLIVKDLQSGKIDPDEQEEIEADFNGLCEIERRIMEVSGELFKLFREPLTGLIAKELYDSFLNNWNNDLNRKFCNSDQEVLSSICFFDDLMEYGDMIVVKMFVPLFIENTANFKTENEDILQSVVYGYGVIAKKLEQAEFKQFNSTVITYIANIMSREVNEDNEKTYDNAVGAMGKYVLYQCPNDANSLTMSKQFIKLLPLKHDLDESKAVAEELFAQIKKNHPLIMNEAVANELKESLKCMKQLNDEKKFLEEKEEELKEILAKFGL